MPFRSEKQRRYLWKNNPEIARKWTNEHGSTPVKAKKGKYQKLEHPDHEIKPIEHKEENVSSKERVEKLLDERKTKKETKKKLVKQGTGYVPGWRPNLSVKAKDSKFITKKTALKGHADSIKEIYDLAKETAVDRMTAWDLENARRIIKSRKSAKRDAMLAETDPGVPYKTGGPIKAKDSKYIQKKKWWSADKLKSTVSKLKEDIQFIKDAKAGKLSPSLTEKAKKKILNQSIGEREDTKTKWDLLHDKEAKGGQSFTPGWKPHLSVRTAKKGSYLTTGLKGYDVKKISKKTSEKLFDLYKHREAGGWKEAKGYKKHLTTLKKITSSKKDILGKKDALSKINFATSKASMLKNLSDKIKYPTSKADTSTIRFPHLTKASKAKDTSFVKRRLTLAGPSSLPGAKALSVLKKLGKRTGIGKAVAAATVVAGAYEAGKRKLFTKDKKKVTKKSIGGETVVMKSGGGYIDDLL